VLLLDVGPTMYSVLPEIKKVCSMLIQKKVSQIFASFGMLWSFCCFLFIISPLFFMRS